MIDLCRRIASSRRFQHATLAVIVANAALIGLETSPSLWARHGGLFDALNLLVQAVFVVEIAVRLVAHAPRLDRFFRDGWNVFDFTIVALSLLPAAGPFATVARLARLFRALRVVSALPELRLIVATMLRSIPSLANVVVLLGLILYVYAVLGVHLFGGVDPAHWGSLPRAGLTRGGKARRAPGGGFGTADACRAPHQDPREPGGGRGGATGPRAELGGRARRPVVLGGGPRGLRVKKSRLYTSF